MAASIRDGTKLSAPNSSAGFTLSVDEEGSKLTLTFEGHHVKQFNLRQNEAELSWTTKRTEEIYSNSICFRDYMMAVIQKQVLFIWEESDRLLSKPKKLKLPKPAKCLLSSEEYGVTVCFDDGTLALVTDLELGDIYGSPFKSKPDYVDCVMRGSSLYILQRASDALYVSIFINKNSGPVTHQAKLKAGTRDVCVHIKDKKLGVITLQDFGGLSWMSLESGDFGLTEEMHSISNISENARITSLGESHLFIAGYMKNKQVGLAIWDSKFGVMKAWKELPETSSSYQIIYKGSKVIVHIGKSIYSYSISIQSSSLASVVGSFVESHHKVELIPSGTENDDIKNILAQLIDGKQTSSESIFQSKLKMALDFFTMNPDIVLANQHLLHQLVMRCLEEKKFSVETVLLDMIKAKLVPTSSTKFLIGEMAKKTCLPVIIAALNNASVIPEESLVDSLRAVVRADVNQCRGVVDEDVMNEGEEEREIECPFESSKAAILNHILQLPFNPVFLQQSMLKLGFDNAMMLLEHITSMIDSGRSNSDSKALPLITAIDWISALLDAYFTQIILSQDAREVIVRLHQMVEKQMTFCEELISLEGLLEQLEKASSFPQKQTLGQYNIHTLHIS